MNVKCYEKVNESFLFERWMKDRFSSAMTTDTQWYVNYAKIFDARRHCHTSLSIRLIFPRFIFYVGNFLRIFLRNLLKNGNVTKRRRFQSDKLRSDKQTKFIKRIF